MARNQNRMPYQPLAGAQGQLFSQSFQQIFDQLPQAGAEEQLPAQSFPQLGWADLNDVDSNNVDDNFFNLPGSSNANANFTNTNGNGHEPIQDFSAGNAKFNANDFNIFQNGFTSTDVSQPLPGYTDVNGTTNSNNPNLGHSYFSMMSQFGYYPLDGFTNENLHDASIDPNTNIQPDALQRLESLDNINANPAKNNWHGSVTEEAEGPKNAASPVGNAASPSETAGSGAAEEQVEDNLEQYADEHGSLFGEDEDTLVDGAPFPESNGEIDADADVHEEDGGNATTEVDEEDDIDDRVDYGEVNIEDMHDPNDIVHVDDFDNPDYDSYGTVTPPDGSVDESQDESEAEEEQEQDQTEDAAPPKKKEARKSKKDDPVYDDVTHHLPALMNSPNLTNEQKDGILRCIPAALLHEMYKYSQVPKKQAEVDVEMTEYNYRPQVEYERLTSPITNAYPKYTGHFKTREQARSWRKRQRLPAKNQADDVDRVQQCGRAFWVREIYNAMIDTPLIKDTPKSIHRTRFLTSVFDPIELESVAHNLFDACIKVHQRGFNRVLLYHKKAIRGKLVDTATESVELRLVKLCSCLRKCKAAVDDAIRGGISMALLVDNPAAREFTKESNNAGNKKRGERLRSVKEAESKEKKIKEKKPRQEKKAKVTKPRGKKGAVAAQ